MEHLWPSSRHSPLLGRAGLGLALGGFATITILGMLNIGTAEGERTIPFFPGPPLLATAFATVVLLCWLAYRFRGRKVRSGALPLILPVPANAPPGNRMWRLKIYVMENDPDALMARVLKDFPNARRPR